MFFNKVKAGATPAELRAVFPRKSVKSRTCEFLSLMGWRYKAGLGMIGAFVLVWVTAAEVTQVGLRFGSYPVPQTGGLCGLDNSPGCNIGHVPDNPCSNTGQHVSPQTSLLPRLYSRMCSDCSKKTLKFLLPRNNYFPAQFQIRNAKSNRLKKFISSLVLFATGSSTYLQVRRTNSSSVQKKMSLVGAIRVIPLSTAKFPSGSSGATFSTTCRLNISKIHQDLIGRVRERITNTKVEISLSAYDTAWVAMVPSRGSSGDEQPQFQQCLDWIVENQNSDGSWGLNPGQPELIKDSFSCTLACVLALRKWNVGHQLVNGGLDFMASSACPASFEIHCSPVGFEVTFAWMVNYAKELDLTLPLKPALLDSLLHDRDYLIRERKQNLEYVAEGLGKSCNWDEIKSARQTSNGSLFNSPATTAAALIHCHDDKCLEYLISVVKACGGWVPTMYPADMYTHLSMVDKLQKLGVDHYFEHEIGIIMDHLYRVWHGKEDVFPDITCQAVLFRLLRTKGYDVSSDELVGFVEQRDFFDKVCVRSCYISTVLELYRASQIRIHEKEEVLERIYDWTGAFLKQQLSNEKILDKQLRKQVEQDLKNFHGTLDVVRSRRSIELYCLQDFELLKTAYRCPLIHNEDFLLLSAHDFRISQALYQEELRQMERWYADCRLDHLRQGRKILQISYISTAAAITGPELSLARISYAQTVVLISCFDDLFDLYGSKEDAFCIIELVREWNTQSAIPCTSEEVEIIYTALYNTVNDVAARAYTEQSQCIKKELVSMWLELLTSFAREKNSWSGSNIESLDEYIDSSCKSIGCKLCVFMSVHFLGTKLSEEMFRSTEWTSLCYHASVVCRLLNDKKSFKREQDEGVLNIVSVLTTKEHISEEEALLKLEQIVEHHKRKVLQLVYQREGSIIPRECKQLFWKTCKIASFFYPHDGGDGFSSPQDIAKDMKDLIWEPLELPVFKDDLEQHKIQRNK